MTTELDYYFRIDYRNKPTNGRTSRFQRVHIHDVVRWEDLISSIMAGEAFNPDTDDMILFEDIVKIEKVNKGVRL